MHSDRYVLVRSITTRPSRGNDDFYTHVSLEEFLFLEEEGFLLESNEYCGNGARYGTPISEVERIWQNKKIPVLDIDVNGFLKVRKQAEAMKMEIESVFIVVDAATLFDRLLDRATETRETLKLRMITALSEVQHLDEYNNLIVNADLQIAARELLAVFEGNHIQDDFDKNTFLREMGILLNTFTVNKDLKGDSPL